MKKKGAVALAVRQGKTKEVAVRLFGEIRELVDAARQHVAVAVNSTTVMLYWEIGTRIYKDVLGEERGEYGRQIVQTLSGQLVAEYGRGFGRRNLFNMLRFAEAFPDIKIVHALSAQLSWTHLRHIIYIDDPLKRTFYAEMCRIEHWSTRTLESKMQGMLSERTAISKKPDTLIKQEPKSLRDEDKLTPDLVFRDPYFLDFLGPRCT